MLQSTTKKRGQALGVATGSNLGCPKTTKNDINCEDICMETQGISFFLPVKVLDKQWADKLMSGSIFMRSLYEFGIWNLGTKIKDQAKEIDNSFRGDISEGLVENINPQIGDPFYNSFPPYIKPYIYTMTYIDEGTYKYFKIYSMYCLTYNISLKQFEQPDKRLRDFGDTAVIISNQKEFYCRILRELNKKFGNNIYLKIDNVNYYNLFKDFGDFNIYFKEKKYEWQKEVRIAVALLNGNEIKIDENGRQFKAVIKDTNRLILEIGNIEDIAVTISTEDLINLKLPADIALPD